MTTSANGRIRALSSSSLERWSAGSHGRHALKRETSRLVRPPSVRETPLHNRVMTGCGMVDSSWTTPQRVPDLPAWPAVITVMLILCAPLLAQRPAADYDRLA